MAGRVIASTVYAAVLYSVAAAADDRLELQAGVRQDSLKWSIAGHSDGTDPNILSELTWKDIRSLQVGLDYFNTLDADIGGRFHFNYGILMQGKNQDSDYAGDNRTQEFNRSYSRTDYGHTLDFLVEVGPNIHLSPARDSSLVVRPALGYTYNALFFYDYKLHNVIPTEYYYSDFHSTYDAAWFGPFVAGEVFAKLNRGTRFKGALGLHRGGYSGRGNWALRDEFQHPESFRQTTNRALGRTLELALETATSKDWIVTYGLEYSLWTSGKGIDRTYFVDGSEMDTRFNGAKWTSYMFRVGIKRNL